VVDDVELPSVEHIKDPLAKRVGTARRATATTPVGAAARWVEPGQSEQFTAALFEQRAAQQVDLGPSLLVDFLFAASPLGVPGTGHGGAFLAAVAGRRNPDFLCLARACAPFKGEEGVIFWVVVCCLEMFSERFVESFGRREESLNPGRSNHPARAVPGSTYGQNPHKDSSSIQRICQSNTLSLTIPAQAKGARLHDNVLVCRADPPA